MNQSEYKLNLQSFFNTCHNISIYAKVKTIEMNTFERLQFDTKLTRKRARINKKKVLKLVRRHTSVVVCVRLKERSRQYKFYSSYVYSAANYSLRSHTGIEVVNSRRGR